MTQHGSFSQGQQSGLGVRVLGGDGTHEIHAAVKDAKASVTNPQANLVPREASGNQLRVRNNPVLTPSQGTYEAVRRSTEDLSRHNRFNPTIDFRAPLDH